MDDKFNTNGIEDGTHAAFNDAWVALIVVVIVSSSH